VKVGFPFYRLLPVSTQRTNKFSLPGKKWAQFSLIGLRGYFGHGCQRTETEPALVETAANHAIDAGAGEISSLPAIAPGAAARR
jgi:hypothetical protein